MRLFSSTILAAVLAATASCIAIEDAPSRELDQRSSPVVYGNDDRQEVYAHSSQQLRGIAQSSIVALMTADAIDMSNPSNVRFSAESLGQRYGLCSGQRFSEQPTAAFCSGTLIDDDLVLTAGHCVQNESECRRTRVVFNYYYSSAGQLATATQSDVFSCQLVRAQALTVVNGRELDYAIIQLDRPATPSHSPAAVRREDRAIGEGAQVAVIGSGSGLPFKIDSGGTVRSARASTRDFFVATTDTFGGNSGSGVFDVSTGALVGILVRGETDYVSSGGCSVVNECSTSGCSGESITYAYNAFADFCATGTSQNICGTSAVCGDGFCASSESHTTCSQDCAAPVCGNGACEADETTSCPDDCSGSTPGSWTCEPSYYGTLDGCDCNCGIRDPDCDNPAQTVLNCNTGEICNASGTCSVPGVGDCGNGLCESNESAGTCPQDCGGEITGGWFCDPDYFATSDGCDCECGAYDPDCDNPSQEIYGCSPSAFCQTDGTCSVREWFCDPGYYGTGDGCDCDCGMYDPDCDDPSQSVLNCAFGQTCNSLGRCVGDSLFGKGCGCAVSLEDAAPPTGWAIVLWLILAAAALVWRRQRVTIRIRRDIER